jgi:hypothetical protein
MRSRKQISSHIQVLVKKHQRLHALIHGYDQAYIVPVSLRDVSTLAAPLILTPGKPLSYRRSPSIDTNSAQTYQWSRSKDDFIIDNPLDLLAHVVSQDR